MTMQSLQAEIDAGYVQHYADTHRELLGIRIAKESTFSWFEHTVHSLVSATVGVVVAAVYYAPYVSHEAFLVAREFSTVFFLSYFVWIACYYLWLNRKALKAAIKQFGSDIWVFSSLATLWQSLPVSTRKVGVIRWVKIGRLCMSFCITKAYKPL